MGMRKDFIGRRIAAISVAFTLATVGFMGMPASAFADQSSLPVKNVAAVTAAPPDDSGMSVADVAERTVNSVVEISTESVKTNFYMQQYISEGAGSGVIISSDGYIVTNNHVIDGAKKITVRLRSGAVYPATLVGNDETSDIALLKIKATGLTPATFGDSSTLRVGEPAIAIGNPLGQLGGSVTSGIISASNREIKIDGKTMNLLQTDAAINPGNSGGGLFNNRAQLIGIVSAKSSGVEIEGLGFAIPINDVKGIISQLKSFGYVKDRVHLGMSLMDARNLTSSGGLSIFEDWNTGVFVQSVEKGGNAANAGILPGDQILKIGEKTISSSDDVIAAMQSYKVGDTVQVIVSRNGQTKQIPIKIAEYKPLSK